MKYFTSDWHVGETQAPNTHSYLRPYSTEVMIEKWMKMCYEKLSLEDEFYFVGDLAITLKDLEIYRYLPKCRKILILGDKEYANKNFTIEEFNIFIKELNIFDEILMNTFVKIGDINWYVSHKPTDCLEINAKKEVPSLCGHIHGSWRSAEMPNIVPIINVAIDAWGGLVSEDFISHQYNAITKYYDINAFPNRW